MGIVRLFVYLLVVSTVSCLAEEGAGTSGTDQAHELVDPTRNLLAILAQMFLFSLASRNYEPTVTERNYEPTVTEDYYELQLPDDEMVNSTDSYPRLCKNLVKLVRDTREAYPDTIAMKASAFLKMVFYTTFFKAAEDETCHPVVKMLDIIILAAHKLRLEYTSDHEDNCTFVELPITDETEYLPTELSTEKPEPFPRRTTKPESTTSMENVTEEVSKSPCSEEKTTEGPSTVSCPQGSEATTAIPKPTTETPAKPCPDNATKAIEKPYADEPVGPTEEIMAEDDYDYPSPPYTGSVRGIPGKHYPNYTDIPITSFSCSDKKYMPGFYADLETGCQVFHVCYEHRRESFLCPVGTIFNQPILACDYWYSSNCSIAPIYYDVNEKTEEFAKEEKIDMTVVELISTIAKHEEQVSVTSKAKPQKSVEEALDDIVKFLPVKVKVTVVPDVQSEPEQIVPSEKPKEKEGVPSKKPDVQDIEDIASKIFDNILTKTTHVVSKTRHSIDKIPEPALPESKKILIQPKMSVPLFKTKVSPLVKTKAAAKAKLAVPIAAKTKFAVASSKMAIPVATKAKVAAVVPIAKATAVKASVPLSVKKLAAMMPKVAMKASVPVIKSKVLASSVPLAKSAVFKSAIPVSKAKLIKTASAPLVKGKLVTLPLAKSKLVGSVPLVKAKLAKSAAISPLTKKALAVGYMKLLKAKKLAAMG